MYETIKVLISVLLIMLIWQAFWRRFMLDFFREKIFSLRDELFDLALNNEHLNFNSNLYKMLESLLNGTIRKGHTLSIMQITLFELFKKIKYSNRDIVPIFLLNLRKEIHSSKMKTDLNRIIGKYEKYVMFYLVFSSFPMTILLILTFTILMVKELFIGIVRQFNFLVNLKADIKSLFKPIFRQYEEQMICETI